MPLLIHSLFHSKVLGTHHLPDTFLGTGGKVVKKRERKPCFHGTLILMEGENAISSIT